MGGTYFQMHFQVHTPIKVNLDGLTFVPIKDSVVFRNWITSRFK
jgi:hypothetical protein